MDKILSEFEAKEWCMTNIEFGLYIFSLKGGGQSKLDIDAWAVHHIRKHVKSTI